MAPRPCIVLKWLQYPFQLTGFNHVPLIKKMNSPCSSFNLHGHQLVAVQFTSLYEAPGEIENYHKRYIYIFRPGGGGGEGGYARGVYRETWYAPGAILIFTSSPLPDGILMDARIITIHILKTQTILKFPPAGDKTILSNKYPLYIYLT